MGDLTRAEVIEILQNMLAWMKAANSIVSKYDRIKALEYAIASLETDEAYQLEYERTTKNDLGVDCISRAEMLRYQEYLHGKMSNEENHKLWEFIKELPPITPQEPKTGHWKLVQRGKSIDICCSNCEEVRIKCYAYNYTIDQLNKEDLKECFECADMRYCPNCGAKMVEPQESEDKENTDES